MINCILDIDKNPDGTPRVTRYGEYRFSLVFKDEDDITHAVVKGFRYNARVRRIIPPSTPLQHGTYTVVDLSKEMEEFLMLSLIELPETTGYGVSLKAGSS